MARSELSLITVQLCCSWKRKETCSPESSKAVKKRPLVGSVHTILRHKTFSFLQNCHQMCCFIHGKKKKKFFLLFNWLKDFFFFFYRIQVSIILLKYRIWILLHPWHAWSCCAVHHNVTDAPHRSPPLPDASRVTRFDTINSIITPRR